MTEITLDLLSHQLRVRVEKKTEEKIAGYLFSANDQRCIEKKLYKLTNEVLFDTNILENHRFYVRMFWKNGPEIRTKESDVFYARHGSIKFAPASSSKSREILEKDENFIISEVDQDSDITFITFNGATSSLQTPPFGAKFILQNGWNLIGVSPALNSQYQGLSLESFRDAVGDRLQGKRVFTYGSSLGAYSAIYFGGSINATIIAASPRNSAHPSIRIPMFENLEFKHVDIKNTPKSSNPLFIIYDPRIAVDTKFIKEQILPHYSEATLMPIPYGGHAILARILELGKLKSFVHSIVNSESFDVYNEIVTLNHKLNKFRN